MTLQGKYYEGACTLFCMSILGKNYSKIFSKKKYLGKNLMSIHWENRRKRMFLVDGDDIRNHVRAIQTAESSVGCKHVKKRNISHISKQEPDHVLPILMYLLHVLDTLH